VIGFCQAQHLGVIKTPGAALLTAHGIAARDYETGSHSQSEKLKTFHKILIISGMVINSKKAKA
jgi:hypothetical protein